MAGRPNRIYRSLDKTSSPACAAPFFLAGHSDPASSSRRRSLDTCARTHAPAYTCTHTRPSGISPSGYFSPSSRPASCATQRRVFVQFSFLAEAFLLPPPASPRSAPLRPARSVFPFSSLLGSSLCCLLLLRVCQRQSFFCPLSHLVSVSQHRELDPAGVSQRSRRRPQNMLSSFIFLTQFLRSGFIRETLTGNLAE